MREEVEEIIKEIGELNRNKREIEKDLKIAAEQQYKKLDDLAARQESIKSQENLVRAEIREMGGNLTRQLDSVEDELASAQAKLKRTIHQLPAEEVQGGLKWAQDNMKIVVSKTQVQVTYRSGLLDDQPWIKTHVFSDGSRAIETLIKPSAIDRLVEEGLLPKDVADSHRLTTKLRAPSVRISYKEGE